MSSSLKTFLIVFFVHSALSQEPLFKPCYKDDIACLTHAAQSFLEKTCLGIESLDIRPIHPVSIPHVDVTLDSGVKVHLRNVVIKELKKLIIHDFKIDISKKSVVLAMESDPEIVADIEVETKDSKLSSKFVANGKVIPTAKYNYNLVPNDEGVEYFTVGPETITCTLQGSPEIIVDTDVANVLWNDSAKVEEIKKKIICSVITPAFHTIIHNLRQSATIYPKTSYFVDL